MKINGKTVSGITCDSRCVKKGNIFVAIKGSRLDGNIFIREAINNGAAFIASQGPMPAVRGLGEKNFLQVKDAREFFARACSRFYRHPSEKLKVIGITGTNGKTTVSYLIEAMIKENRKKCGVIGTVNYHYANRAFCAKNTTPGAAQINPLLAQMHKAKVGYCVMEVSSHALDQRRTAGINFSAAIFTNLTQDHLDYHKTLEKYFLAKSKLFTGLGAQAAAIINIDDRFGRRLKNLTRGKFISYAIERRAEVWARNIKFGLKRTSFDLIYGEKKIRIKSNLAGRYNVYNLLAAISWGLSAGMGTGLIARAISKFKSVRGRLEKAACFKGFSVFVDYAHTEDALFNVLSALRPLVKGKIYVVFGCGGERDKLKRPKMGKVVSELADYAIITNDNPRNEEPLDIIKDIKKGIKKNNYRVICDRRAAIKAGLSLAKPGDLVLVAGKGHESYQIIKNKILSFDDRKVIKECLRSAS